MCSDQLQVNTCVFPNSMGTLQRSSDDPSDQKTKISISYPVEIVEEILTRLPVKPILQFRSVSKPWRSLISTPSFTKLHFTRSRHRTALFISAYDPSARKRYFLSAPTDGGRVIHITTLENVPPSPGYTPEAEHLNGLVCFSSANGSTGSNYAFVVNASTRKVFKVYDSLSWSSYGDGNSNSCYLFGFDESRNEHKILNIRMSKYVIDSLIFSMSSYSWRKINAKLPVDPDSAGTIPLQYSIRCSVCVDSVIHFMITGAFDIFTFDLRTEKFAKISIPDDAGGHSMTTRVIKINGCVGIVCHDMESNKMHIWLLQDYGNRIWVKENITYPDPWFEPWVDPSGHFMLDSLNMDEVIFFSSRLSKNVISVVIYNIKSRSFRSVQFTLDQPFLWLNNVQFDVIKCYAESILPLKRNRKRN